MISPEILPNLRNSNTVVYIMDLIDFMRQMDLGLVTHVQAIMNNYYNIVIWNGKYFYVHLGSGVWMKPVLRNISKKFDSDRGIWLIRTVQINSMTVQYGPRNYRMGNLCMDINLNPAGPTGCRLCWSFFKLLDVLQIGS